MLQHLLDLGMVEQMIGSATDHHRQARLVHLGHDGGIPILPIKTDQSHGMWQVIGIQVRVNGATGRPQFLAVVSIACSRVGSYPLTRMHLEDCRPATHHLSRLSSQISWRTHLIQSSSCRREFLPLGKGSLPSWLPSSINIEDHMTVSRPFPHSPDGSLRPPLCEALFELRAKCLQTRRVNSGKTSDSGWSDEGAQNVRTGP